MDSSQVIIYNTPDGKSAVSLYAQDGSVWMNQKQLAELFATSVPNISIHISNILEDNELNRNSVVKDFLTTAEDGKEYTVRFYALDMILAVGFRVRSKRGVQFRKWANQHLKVYLQKGFVVDSERLKNPDGRPDYFDELLEQIRDIRASEKRFYQKVRDLFALSTDYDASDKATQMFFAQAQNKLLYAITRHTAAELVMKRADASAPNMALTSWKGNVVRQQDIYIAKNYLSHDELDSLNRLVTVFLEAAELRAKNKQAFTMDFWRANLDGIIQFQGLPALEGNGSITKSQMEEQVTEVYATFHTRRKALDAQQADEQDLMELNKLQEQVKKRNQENET